MTVRAGDIVLTWGPWSNGHMEQVAIVAHVYGQGETDETLVNLHVFQDLGPILIVSEVPWYQSRNHALAAVTGTGVSNGGAQCCWSREL